MISGSHAIIVLLLGCGGKKDEGTTSERIELPPELARWMPADASAAWQGAWVTPLRLDHAIHPGGSLVALEITGATAKTFDGKQERTFRFAIATPCSAELEDGPNVYSTSFVVKDGQLRASPGAAGIRKGTTAIVCSLGGSRVTTVDEGGCRVWSRFGSWTSKPGTCTWGSDTLTIGDGASRHGLGVRGDLLFDDQFDEQARKHQRAASYAEAKQKVLDHVKHNDPGEQAKAAGGTVGDTGTVLGLIATFATDPKSVVDKKVTLTGQFLSRDTRYGRTTISITLADSRDATPATLTVKCHTQQTDPSAFAYDRNAELTVTGVVDSASGMPALEACRVEVK